MTRRFVIALTLLVTAAFGLSADASARLRIHRLHAKPTVRRSSAPAPVITSVTPLKTNVGQKLTVLGKNFKPGANATKVFFLRQGGGVTSTGAGFATTTRLVVTIPESLTPLLRGTGRTRFQIRILTTRYGDPTKLTKSPLIGPASTKPPVVGPPEITSPEGDCNGNGIKNKDEADDDSDNIADVTETGLTHTDPCKKDTDGDTVSDGYEWQAAKDMNNTTPFNVPDAGLPFPGKKPWPNPLMGDDASIDHDGDGLTMLDEWQLYRYYGGNLTTLNYSDGKQVSKQVAAPTDPVLDYMDFNSDGVLSDDERDGDSDGLTNWDEKYGKMTQRWWDAWYNGQAGRPKESHYALFDFNNPDGEPLDFPAVSHVDPDSDGDSIPDGADDQDHDGLSNAFEVSRPWDWMLTYVSLQHPGANETDNPELYQPDGPLPHGVGPNPWARVQPFNPCKPVASETCHLHPRIGYYGDTEDWETYYGWRFGTPPAAPWLYDADDYPEANGP